MPRPTKSARDIARAKEAPPKTSRQGVIRHLGAIRAETQALKREGEKIKKKIRREKDKQNILRGGKNA